MIYSTWEKEKKTFLECLWNFQFIFNLSSAEREETVIEINIEEVKRTKERTKRMDEVSKEY